MNLFTNKLSEPNGSTITNTEVPVSPNRNRGIIRDTAKLSFLAQAIHLATVVTSFLASIKVTVEFLLNHIIGHPLPALRLYLFFCENACVSYRKYFKKPFIWVPSSYLRKFPPVILAAWRVNKCTPSTVSCQDWLNKVIGHRVHQGPFRENNSAWIRPHYRVVRICANQLYQALTLGPIDPNFHFGVIWVPIDYGLGDVVQHLFPIVRHTIPQNSLGLSKGRKKIIVCSWLQICAFNHIIPHGRIFPPASMNNPASIATTII